MPWCEKCSDFHFGPHDCPCGASLSDGEKEVMKLIAKGWNNKIISETLLRSVDAIRSRLKRLYMKFDIDGNTYHKRLKLALIGQEFKEV